MSDEVGRVTLREVYDLLSEFRAEFQSKFDELPNHYASKDSLRAIEFRVNVLEESHVPMTTHNICNADVQTLKNDVSKLKERVVFTAGSAAVIGFALSALFTAYVNHLL